MAELKAYINRDSRGRFIPGSVVYSERKPVNGDYVLIVAGVEQNQSSSSNPEVVRSTAYTSVIRKFYPRAVTAPAFAKGLVNFIKGEGYFPENVLLMESKPSDDVNASIFSNFENIGQTPETMSSFSGALQAGGLGGYMHAGLSGLTMLANHALSNVKNNAILIVQSPGVGISEKGFYGRIKRKGKSSEKADRTNLSVARAIDLLDQYVDMPNCCEDKSLVNDGEFCNLIEVLWGARTEILSKDTYEDKMKCAMDYLIRYQHESNWGGATYGDKVGMLKGINWPLDTDIYVLTGTFINADYKKPAHFDTFSFKKLKRTAVVVDYVPAHIEDSSTGKYSISINGSPYALMTTRNNSASGGAYSLGREIAVSGLGKPNTEYILRPNGKSSIGRPGDRENLAYAALDMFKGASMTDLSSTQTLAPGAPSPHFNFIHKDLNSGEELLLNDGLQFFTDTEMSFQLGNFAVPPSTDQKRKTSRFDQAYEGPALSENNVNIRFALNSVFSPIPVSPDHLDGKAGRYSVELNGILAPTKTVFDDNIGKWIIDMGKFLFQEIGNTGTFELKDHQGTVKATGISFTKDTAEFQDSSSNKWRVNYSPGPSGPIRTIRNRFKVKDLTKKFIKSLL
tara:strand:+ start:25 stop:1893 length:1869 start_codon:yes stop_codon:yes gene_type:complete